MCVFDNKIQCIIVLEGWGPSSVRISSCDSLLDEQSLTFTSAFTIFGVMVKCSKGVEKAIVVKVVESGVWLLKWSPCDIYMLMLTDRPSSHILTDPSALCYKLDTVSHFFILAFSELFV